MDTQPFKERMLEIENLTDELEDSEANWLLNWGAAQLDWVLHGVKDQETAGQKANALYAVMRKINRMMAYTQGSAPGANQTRKLPEELAADFMALAELTGDAYCHKPKQTLVEAQSAAAHLPGLKPSIAIEFLARWALLSCDLH